MRLGSILCVALCGCSFTFDDDSPDLPLLGAPPSLSSLQKLNNGPVYGSAIVSGRMPCFLRLVSWMRAKLLTITTRQPR